MVFRSSHFLATICSVAWEFLFLSLHKTWISVKNVSLCWNSQIIAALPAWCWALKSSEVFAISDMVHLISILFLISDLLMHLSISLCTFSVNSTQCFSTYGRYFPEWFSLLNSKISYSYLYHSLHTRIFIAFFILVGKGPSYAQVESHLFEGGSWQYLIYFDSCCIWSS